MEGNQCYKFSTVRNYIERSGVAPIRLALDVGANVGMMSLEMRAYFPKAKIFSFEAVRQYYLAACRATCQDPDIKVFNLAITSQHVFSDDLGTKPRNKTDALKIFKALPGAAGWIGGSQVVNSTIALEQPGAYQELSETVCPVTLDELVAITTKLACADEVDYVKMDCEGCEHSVLGCASSDALKRIRFIGGEYHNLGRFYNVMRGKLFQTHRVNLVGDGSIGSFFCERKGERVPILQPDNTGMLQLRPWLHPEPIEWHLFNADFVDPIERVAHGM